MSSFVSDSGVYSPFAKMYELDIIYQELARMADKGKGSVKYQSQEVDQALVKISEYLKIRFESELGNKCYIAGRLVFEVFSVVVLKRALYDFRAQS